LWKGGSADREDLFRLLEMLMKRGLKDNEMPFLAARECLLTSPKTDNEFRAAADFCEKYPDAVSAEEREVLRRQFLEFASDHPLRLDNNPEWLREVAADLEYIGERLDVDTQKFTQSFAERAEEIESEFADRQQPDDYEERWESSNLGVDDVQAMFDGLMSNLRDT
jgi:nucleoid-associated protein YejK